ncbi:MAG: hypothetical protein AB7Q76_13730 [Gammaproteobacteria bacterium]
MHEPLSREDYRAPRPVELPAAAPARTGRTHASPATALMLLGAAAIGVVGVFAWLPSWVERAAPARDDAPTATAAVPAAAPADDTDLLLPEPPDARPAAQDALAELLPAVGALRERRIATWDPDALAAIEHDIATGERAYRERRFTAARAAYMAAAARVETAQARIPEVVRDRVDDGERALLSHDPHAAARAFALALALAPDDAAAAAGLARAETYDRVVALLNEAKGYERMQDPARAAEAYREALRLDPAAGDARQGLQRIERARADAAFTAALSRGFTALEKNDYAAAEQAFASAVKMRPQSQEAAHALAQARERATAARIERALAAAAAAERAENWPEARAQYAAALALDEALAAARDGGTRATARARLAVRLRDALAAPARLADAAAARAVEALLAEARAVPAPGPRLARDITALDAALTAARTPVGVTLRSDGVTDVTLLKVGRLGAFAARNLTLTPGRYTAVGTRNGYRDTRLEFTVTAGAVVDITIQCQEALPFGR